MKILPLALLAHVQLCVWARSPSSPAPPGNGERIKDTEITATHLVSLNQKLQPVLSDLMQVEFFRYFKMDLNKHCPFWDEHGMCHMEQCAVSPILEDDYVDQMWKDQDLGAIQYQRKSPFQEKCDFTDMDFCVRDDELSSTSGAVYIDLIENPEKFTGYMGDSANRIWHVIYEQNCFKFMFDSHSKAESSLLPIAARNTLDADDVCVEKRAFFRVISGLHASISVHLCYDHLNKETGKWEPNVNCYESRIGTHPERIQNLYFLYTLMLEAVAQLDKYLDIYTFCSGNKMENMRTRILLTEAMNNVKTHRPYINVGEMFAGDTELKEGFKNQFRNVSRIMDCVGCEKCRLWGKIQTLGIGTALKILFSFDPKLHALTSINGAKSFSSSKSDTRFLRTEVVSLFNALTRFAESLDMIQKFEALKAMQGQPQYSRALRQLWNGVEEIVISLQSVVSLRGLLMEARDNPPLVLRGALVVFATLLIGRWLVQRLLLLVGGKRQRRMMMRKND
eukprot:Partr_v1_DN28293_c0_g1_i2_m75163 putative S. cerevisiae